MRSGKAVAFDGRAASQGLVGAHLLGELTLVVVDAAVVSGEGSG